MSVYVIDLMGTIHRDQVQTDLEPSVELMRMYGGCPREVFWSYDRQLGVQFSLWDNLGSRDATDTLNERAMDFFAGFYTDATQLISEADLSLYGIVVLTSQRPRDPNMNIECLVESCDSLMLLGISMTFTDLFCEMHMNRVIEKMFKFGKCVLCLEEDMRVCLCMGCDILACYDCVLTSSRIFEYPALPDDEDEVMLYVCNQCNKLISI